MTRPPVITIMGHVDHGKTTLLDFIRKSRVVTQEAGGITQHIGAYQVSYGSNKLTFIDTPGHAAFNKMRERGANITDLIVLVVAANDGVKPQTIESIRHIKKSGAPFIVAINKIDLPNIRIDVVKSELAEHGIVVTDFGGDVDTVEISALTGKGVDSLLENLVVMSELMELKADSQAPLEAVVIEATLDNKKGASASVIVQKGTLKIKQDLEIDGVQGRVRALFNELGESLSQAKPGDPVEIIGLKKVPHVGSIVREAGVEYQQHSSQDQKASGASASGSNTTSINPTETQVVNPFANINFDSLFDQKEKLNLIIRADVEGTLEVIHQNLDEDQVNVLLSGVGEVTESDIEMAETSGAKVISFHTKVPARIKDLAKNHKVKIKEYDVIYKLIEDLQKQILKLIDAHIDEVELGTAEILQIFEMKGERIAGCRVKTGEIKKTDSIHLKRGEDIILDPVVKSLMQGKQEIDSVKNKSEFGITFKTSKKLKSVSFKVGDMIVAYKIDED
jgi:translation initiation factor IF-2